MVTIVRSLLFVVLFVSLAWSDLSSPKISDAEYKQYIAASNEFKAAENDINNIYKKLMSVVNESEKIALRDEQREWIKMRDTKAFSEGQKGSQIYIDSLVKLTTQRKSELEHGLLNLKPTPALAIDSSPTRQTAENQNIQQQSTQQTGSESKKQTGKYIVISLLSIVIVSVFLHVNGKLIIYKDYTDAAITISGVIGSIIILLVCRRFLNLSVETSWGISLLFFFAIFIFVLRMTYVTNNNIVFVILSLLTKYATTFLYAILMLTLMFSDSSRRKGESSAAFELRRRRENAQTKAWMAIITALFIWFVRISTRIREWSPIGNYFTLSLKKLNLEEIDSVNRGEELATEEAR